MRRRPEARPRSTHRLRSYPSPGSGCGCSAADGRTPRERAVGSGQETTSCPDAAIARDHRRGQRDRPSPVVVPRQSKEVAHLFVGAPAHGLWSQMVLPLRSRKVASASTSMTLMDKPHRSSRRRRGGCIGTGRCPAHRFALPLGSRLRGGSVPPMLLVNEPWSYPSGPSPAGSGAASGQFLASDREAHLLGRPYIGLEHLDLGRRPGRTHNGARRASPSRPRADAGRPPIRRARR